MIPTFAILSAALLAAPLLSAPPHAGDDSVFVSLNLFSGRPRPRAKVAEPAVVSALVGALESRLAAPLPYSMLPPMPSSPAYTGVLMLRYPDGKRGPTYFISDGWISTTPTEPCYRDSGHTVERLAVSAAFALNDLDAPGGAKPMSYLACAVPDSLHPDIPCTTGLRRPARPAWNPAEAGLPFYDAAGHHLERPEEGFIWRTTGP